jgi:hypothetical protein
VLTASPVWVSFLATPRARAIPKSATRCCRGEEQVLRLDVAVDDAVVVGVLERLGRVARDPERLVHRKASLPPEPVAERLALHVGHGEPEPAGGLTRIVDRQDVGMLEPGGEADLPLEPVGAEGGGQLRQQHLERHRPVVLEVAGEIDHGHAAAPARARGGRLANPS